MRYFHSFAELVYVARKGWHIEGRAKIRVATKLWYAFAMTDSTRILEIEKLISGHYKCLVEQDTAESRFTPAECEVMRDFTSWWSGELSYGYDKYPCFQFVNLNEGRSLVIAERAGNR